MKPFLKTDKKKTAFFLLLFLIFIIYSNSFNASWHLDDYNNILFRQEMDLKDLSVKSLIKSLYLGDGPDKKIYRPVACLSFALNRYFSGSNVCRYHIVNISIHIISAFFLYLTILLIFETPSLKNRYKGSRNFIALFSAVLWAVNPIQTQAVTYIVQRMASLAAMFYIISVFYYIKGRLDNKRRRLLYFLSSFICFLFAIGSKENAVLLPFSWVLIEVVFFCDLYDKKIFKKVVWASSIICVFGILSLIFIFISQDNFSVFQSYASRSFTMKERILTQPRVVLFYLSQMFYPLSQRFSIEHDITASTDFFTPLSTIPSITGILCILFVGIILVRKSPFISFAVLFFFLNHLIESTILPLELIFEHRNYLPSFFIFVPLSMGIKFLIDYYKKQNRVLYFTLIFFVVFIIVNVSLASVFRNYVWESEKSLWENVILNHPNSARGYHNLAWGYYEKIGAKEKSIKLYNEAFKKKSQTIQKKSICLNNIGTIYYRDKKYLKAAKYFKEAIQIRKLYFNAYLHLTRSLIKLNRFSDAKKVIGIIKGKHEKKVSVLNLYGFILLKTGMYEEAYKNFEKCLNISQNNGEYLLNMGSVLSMMGKYRESEVVLKKTVKNSINFFPVLLALADNSIKAGDKKSAEKYISEIFNIYSISILKRKISDIVADNSCVPISFNVINPLICKKMDEISEGIIE